MKSIKIIILSLLTLIGFYQMANAQFKVIGYAASWAQTSIQYNKLTHINYSFALPMYGGRLKAVENPAYLRSIVGNAHANGVKVYIAIGGWSDNGAIIDPVFESIGADPASRANLVNDALYIVNTYNLDGVDMDWEYPEAGNSATNFTALMKELSNALRPRGKGLSFAGPADGYNSNGYQAEVFQYVDHVNIMAYDGAGANHSTYQFAVDGLNLYKSKGCPANKCVVGVPFYARPSWRSYAQLVAAGANPNSDWFGSDAYNGIPTIKQKTQMALDQAGGIMIWELSQDAQGANSLLSAINDVVKSSTNNNNNTGVATVYKHCEFGGYAGGLPAGDYNYGGLYAKGIANEDISSLKVNSGYEIELFENDNFTGASIVFLGENPCLVANGWNDRTTSLKVRPSNSTNFSKTIQAEEYGAMAGVQKEGTTDAGGGQNVGYIDNADWMAYYNITFPNSGFYKVEYRVASLYGGNSLSLDLNAGSIQLGAVNIPNTGGWQNWTTVSHTVNINTGTYNVGVFAAVGGFNLNWIRFTKVKNAREEQSESTPTEVYAAESLDIFPNPVSQELNFSSLNDISSGQVRILDMFGHEVQKIGQNVYSLDVSTLKSGVYTLEAISKDNLKIVKRFIKQ